MKKPDQSSENSLSVLRNLPGTDTLLNWPEVKQLMAIHNAEVVKFFIKNTMSNFRDKVKNGADVPEKDEILSQLNLGLKN